MRRRRSGFACLLVLTCTGVSFFHGSNDGQKGMGLIMLILIGTVPTAYALNHAVGYSQVQDFVAVSEQAAKVMSAHVDSNAVIDDPRADLTEYLQTKKQTPTTILAERQMILEIEHEVNQYKTLKGVPSGQQANVRNDMYISSEALRLFAKSKKPEFTAEEAAVMANYKKKLDLSTKFIPTLGESGGGDCAGAGHDDRLEAHRGDGRREDRENPLDLWPGRFSGNRGHVYHLGGGQLRLAGQYHPRALLRRGGNHDGKQERVAVVDHPQHRCCVGLYFACSGADGGGPVLGLCAVCP